jgi:hypothetical protein
MRSLRSWFPDWSRALRAGILGNAAASVNPRASQVWRGLYVAALFENDKGRTPQRIAEAKKALVARARELFWTAGDHHQERTDIDDALHVLQVLERCMVNVCGQRR